MHLGLWPTFVVRKTLQWSVELKPQRLYNHPHHSILVKVHACLVPATCCSLTSEKEGMLLALACVSAPAPSPLDGTPTQIFSLAKILSYPRLAGNLNGDGIEEAWLNLPASGRTVVDCGLHKCEALAEAVRRGFVVHGFEPVPSHIANCRRRLRRSEYSEVPVTLGSDGLPNMAAAVAAVDRARANRTRATSSGGGFAYLYQAAVGENTGSAVIRLGSGGFTSLADRQARAQKGAPLTVPVVRIDQLVRESVWLLKLDLQGYEAKALRGAACLFADYVVANVLTEFTPRFLSSSGEQPRALPDLLKRYGMVCFDLRDGDGSRQRALDHKMPAGDYYAEHPAPWSLGKTHPLDVDEYIEGMAKNEHRGKKLDESGKPKPASWLKVTGSFDDLACINIVKVWRPNSS